MKYISFVFVALLLVFSSHAQQKKKQVSLKDSLDGAFDLSDYIIDARGFVAVPNIITEPAVGGFGGALVPVFIRKKPPYIDSINGTVKRTPVPPDITGALAMYTINNSWMLGGFRSGTFVKSRIKYVIGGGYANINMSFYQTFDLIGEKELKFNIKTLPFILQAAKRIGYSKWYLGFKYLFLSTDLEYTGDTALKHLAKPLEYSSIVSQLGIVTEFDTRDNIFTPNRGLKLHLDAIRSDDIFGSDYDFWRMNYYTYIYKTISRKVIGGLRIDGQQAFGDVPFYLKPYISLRGIPINRYQGNADILTELEMRYDFIKRWSIMLFGGTGKAFDSWSDFGRTDLVYSYGTGFRYLLARKFKLRVGIDIARGPEDWAYYIVFGSNWLK